MPTILKAILFEENPERYDVFLLIDRQEKENYSIENELILRKMLHNRIKILRYTDEFDEELYIRSDFPSIVEYTNDEDLHLDGFVHKLWARRYIVNNLRLSYEKHHGKYDFIVRTRFDIYLKGDIRHLSLPPPKRVIYAGIDVLSIGDTDSINCESLLGLCFPVIGKHIEDKNERRSWQVASEYQLLSHLKRNKIKVIGCGLTGGIRRLNVEKLEILIESFNESFDKDSQNLTILYGIEGNYTDVTATYMSKISNKEMYGSFSSMFGDPIPGRQKHIIIEHLHGRFKIDD